MKILFLTKYHKEGSSSRYRYYNYFKWFISDNHEVTVKPLLYDGYVNDLYQNKKKIKRIIMLFWGILNRMRFLLFLKNPYDAVIIEKELFTFMPFFIEKFFLKRLNFIVDFDDNISARYQLGIAKFFLANKINKVVELSSGVTVGNNWYFELFKNIDSKKIHYLPTVIDRDLYQSNETNVVKPVFLNVVWVGSMTTVKYLKLIDHIFVNLQKKYDFKLKVVGGYVELKCAVEYIEWNSQTEVKELLNSDIGIMPLEDTNWEKGKCGFKLIQYMASGLPVVASPSPANEEIIGKEFGFIARNDEEWINSISFLLSDKTLRSRLGDIGQRRIFEQYSYQTWAPRFIQLIKNIQKQ